MKILLFGEFSSFHKNLKVGLESLGHNVTLASSGDGWKKVDRDLDLDYSSNIINKKLASRIYLFLDINKFIGYDIVQIISPDVILNYFPRKLFFSIP